MDRERYLLELREQLTGRMAPAELERIMIYYQAYFEESGAEREQAVMEELGSPAELAARILQSTASTPQAAEPGQGWPVGLALFLVPLFLLLTAVVGVLAAGIFLGFLAGGLAAGWSGVVIIGRGVSILFHSGLSATMLYGGQGLMAMGAGLLLILAGLALGRICLKGAAALGGLALRRGRTRV